VLWDVLLGTGIVYLPFLGILIDNWREPAEGGEFGTVTGLLRIPAKMTAHSGERDRFAHRIGAGEFFLTEAVTISQVGRMVLV